MNILIVDDKEENLYLLESLLKGCGYEVVSAVNGQDALEKLRDGSFSMIISDILMPVMDGYSLLKKVRAADKHKDIPFVFYTATYTDAQDEDLALQLDADKYIRKPIDTEEFVKIIQNVIKGRINRIHPVKPTLMREEEVSKVYSERLVNKLEKEIIERKWAEAKLQESYKKLEKTMRNTILAMTRISEGRDPYNAGHQQRVARLSDAIAKEMDLSEAKKEGIHMSAVIHDIGKLYVPAEILTKPGRITEIEFSMIKTHPQFSYDILKTIDFPWPVADIVYQHHERLDGVGYPNGLSGDDILLEARIISVADVVEAMFSHRPYRPGLGIEKALKEISKNKGIHYDAEIVETCLKLFALGKFKFE